MHYVLCYSVKGVNTLPSKNKLSIFLIKEEFAYFEDIMRDYNSMQSIDADTEVYLGYSSKVKPQWATNFLTSKVDTNSLFVANARAVLLQRVKIVETGGTRIFAITMGYGKNMLNDDVTEERFGIKVVLNTISNNSLRRVNKVNIGGNQKLSYEQLPLKSGIADFGIDINRDLVSHITGISDVDDYAKGAISGSDALFVSAEVDISNINDFLVKTYKRYCSHTYKQNFSWIDHIQNVKSQRENTILNNYLIEAVNNQSPLFWMAVPDVINWTEISGFKYNGQTIFDDIDIHEVCASFRNPLTTTDQLKAKQIHAISSVDDSKVHTWSALKCVFGECSIDGQAYCINNGKWYKINSDFVDSINSNYTATAISNIEFPACTNSHKDENAYSTYVQQNNPNGFLLMDRKNITYGGGHSSIELCDLLSIDCELIHLKPYSGSSTLSHLFNQGIVSAELLLSDPKFLALANAKIAEQPNGSGFVISNERAIKVVFGIISKNTPPLPQIPFFSKVAFNYVKNRLVAFGVDVSIKNIIDERTKEQ